MADTAAISPAQDQDFLNAPVHEKHAYLMDTDPDYAKAPPHEQLQYMNDLHQTQFSERGAAQQPPIDRPAGGEADIERSWQKTEGLREQRERVGQRAMRSPNPVTSASTVVMPLASEMQSGKLLSAVRKTGGRLAGGAVGASSGGYTGRRVGGWVGAPNVGEAIGTVVGGIGGWILGGGRGEIPEGGQPAFEGDRPAIPGAGAPQPTTEGFEEASLKDKIKQGKYEKLPKRSPIPKPNVPYGGTSSAERGRPDVQVDSSGLGETSGPKAKLVTKMQAAKDEADAAAKAGAGTGRRVILAGEGIDPMRTESAGSAAQATEADLRRLASAGDASARQELVRRRLQRGVTDYKNVPLPRGQGGGIIGGGTEEVPQPVTAPEKPADVSSVTPDRRTRAREVQGPDLMRTARAQELRTTLQDPSLSARDRRIMQDQLDDIKNNPFERHEGGDIQSMKKPKPTMSRAEAEAGTEARKAGRKARFGGPPVPEEIANPGSNLDAAIKNRRVEELRGKLEPRAEADPSESLSDVEQGWVRDFVKSKFKGGSPKHDELLGRIDKYLNWLEGRPGQSDTHGRVTDIYNKLVHQGSSPKLVDKIKGKL